MQLAFSHTGYLHPLVRYKSNLQFIMCTWNQNCLKKKEKKNVQLNWAGIQILLTRVQPTSSIWSTFLPIMRFGDNIQNTYKIKSIYWLDTVINYLFSCMRKNKQYIKSIYIHNNPLKKACSMPFLPKKCKNLYMQQPLKYCNYLNQITTMITTAINTLTSDIF